VQWRSGPVFSGLAKAVSRSQMRGQANLPSLDPSSGAALMVINHTSPWDVVVMMAALRAEGLWVDAPCVGGCAPGHRHFKVMATADLLNYPITKQMAARSGVIPVGRDHGTAALLAARRALVSGELVVIYPEGDLSVTDDGAPREWRAGASVLARGVPVYPVAHHDSRTLGNGGENMTLSIAVGLTRWTSPQLVRIYAGEPVLADQLEGLDPHSRQVVLEDSLRSAWKIAQSGVLPV